VFGANNFGQLGLNSTKGCIFEPTLVHKIMNTILDIFVGPNHSFAITSKNYIYNH
jgi:alpha-tubulin suppressor-like RCC1 family protein